MEFFNIKEFLKNRFYGGNKELYQSISINKFNVLYFLKDFGGKLQLISVKYDITFKVRIN